MAKRRKRRTNLEMLVQSTEEELYKTTREDCERWFRILNRELFDNELCPVDEIEIGRRKGVYAIYECYDEKCEDGVQYRLVLKDRYRSKKFFVEVLAHEMVHHYQALNDQPLGHGRTFLKWRKRLNEKGLQLVRAYKE